nr:contains similarity to sugar (and other) transporters (Pfam: PF00083, score=20.4, E=2.6e-06, N=1 [Arabidopsis thaliana]
MAEESLLPSHTEDVSASPNKSSSLLSEISNASTRPFVLAFTVGSCGALSFGCIVGYTAPTQSSIMKDLNLSIADAIFIFWIDIDSGANPWSINLWEIGRFGWSCLCLRVSYFMLCFHNEMLINSKSEYNSLNIFLFFFSVFFCFVTKDVRLLDLGRLLQGISVGISSYLGPIYISELAPRNLRGAASSLMQLFVGVGLSAFYALGTAVAWRKKYIYCTNDFVFCLWTGSIPSLVVLPLLFFIPESPRWLVSTRLYYPFSSICLAKVGREKEVEGVLLSLRGAKSDVSDEAATILIGVVLISMPQLGGLNGYTFYTDTIFTSTGVLLVDISGRRSLLLVYFGSYGLGMGPIPWIIASEIYPVDVKGAAGTVCNLVTSISSWLVTYSFNFLLQWSSTGTFMMFATVMGLGFVFTAKLVPETKGKSLEEIQSAFTDSTSEDSTIF